KVEDDKLTFSNYSASPFFKTLHNSSLFMILFAVAMFSFIFLIIDKEKFACLFISIFAGSVLSAIFIFTAVKTRAYFTITPQGIEVKTDKNRLFIDRDNISDIYFDVQGISNEQVVTSSSRNEQKNTVFSVYLKTLQSVNLPELNKDKDIFDLFVSDYIRLSKLFIIVLLSEAKRILNLPRQNECFETGLQNINILKCDNSGIIFEKRNQTKISLNKYQVKIEENGIFGGNKNIEKSIQNNSSFRIFENIKRGFRTSSAIKIGGIVMRHHISKGASSDFGLALCDDISSKKPDILVNDINLDEALYILRKINCLRYSM
ncbi:hypothetical protein IJJ97_01850, partial [bacterium]|nr:hypothetical protein [bacterium]